MDGRRFAIAVGTLPQGRNRIAVAARDRAGNVARTTTVVLVNSSEEFGEADLAPGARGKDVMALQQRLREAKVYPKKGKLTGVLDGVTAEVRGRGTRSATRRRRPGSWTGACARPWSGASSPA